jgi:CRP-like cAMP-binding protein
MAARNERPYQLRRQLDKAIEKGRTKEALAALSELAKLEPKEPRWPQRQGDLLRREGRAAEAEEAYLRALGVYSQQGFLPQAVALAKVVVALNPERAAILDQINQQATRDLRRTLSGARRPSALGAPAPAPAVGPQAAAPPGPAPSPAAAARQAPASEPEPPSVEVDLGSLEPKSIEVDLGSLELGAMQADRESLGPEVIEIEPDSDEPETRQAPARPPSPPAPPAKRQASGAQTASRWGATVEKHQSFIGGIPLEGMLAAARALEPAQDRQHDEVRFSDVPDEECIEIQPAELDGMRPTAMGAEPSGPSPDDWDAERLAALSGAALFAEISPEALGALARAAELVELRPGEHVFRRGEDADALYVIVEGTALVVLPWLAGGGIDLVRGQIFGEAALLQDGKRDADVRAKGGLLLLRIPKSELGDIVAVHSEVHQLLFDLLVQRRIANTLQTSSLFAAFDLEQRKELATMFEVRWAAPGVVLQERGKRSDGLYLLLVGEFAEVKGDEHVPLGLGTVIGHRSLLSHGVATRTIVALTESVVLRMPAKRFGSFAVQFPPALADLASQAAGPESG